MEPGQASCPLWAPVSALHNEREVSAVRALWRPLHTGSSAHVGGGTGSQEGGSCVPSSSSLHRVVCRDLGPEHLVAKRKTTGLAEGTEMALGGDAGVCLLALVPFVPVVKFTFLLSTSIVAKNS